MKTEKCEYCGGVNDSTSDCLCNRCWNLLDLDSVDKIRESVRMRDRKKTLDQLTEESQKMGLYD